MKYTATISKRRKSLMWALPMALILMAVIYIASRHDGGRAAAAVMPASSGKTVQIDRKHDATAEATPLASGAAAQETARPALVDGKVAAAESASAAEPINEKSETGRHIGSGEASYYGRRFAGRPTASGETFDPSELTAAHKTLPFGSRVRVTNTGNGRSVVVRVNDRGPYVHGRLIDVSRRAAEVLGMISRGTANVRLELIS